MARSRLAAHLNDGEQRVRAELAIEERVPRVLCDHAPRREHGNAAVLQLSLAVPGKVQLRVNSCPPHTGSCTWTCTCARTLLCSAPVPSSALRHPAASATRPALPPCTGSMSARSLLHRLRAGVLGEAERIKVRQRRAVANQAAHLHLHSHTAGRWAHQHRGRRKGSYPARKRGTRKSRSRLLLAAVEL